MKYVSFFALALASISPFAQAQTAPTAAQLAEMDVQRYTRALNLSSTEKEEALTIFTTQETAEITVRAAEETAEKSLLAAIEANETSTIATLSATLGGLHGQDIQARAVASAALYAILTTEQQTKYVQILEQMGILDGGSGAPGGPFRH